MTQQPKYPRTKRPTSTFPHFYTFILAAGALLLALLSTIPIFLNPLGDDEGWFLYWADRLLHGAPLPYGDDPPLMYYLVAPIALLSHATGLSAIYLFNAAVFMLCLLSVFLCGVILSRYLPEIKAYVRWLFLIFALAVLLLLPIQTFYRDDFGEREHLLLALSLPYLCLSAARAKGRTILWPSSLLVGGIAAVGMALKPHFGLIWLATELYLISFRRVGGPWKRLESTIIIGFLLTYAVTVLVLFPEFLVEARWTLKTYGAYQVSAPVLLMASVRPLLLLFLAVLLRTTDSGEHGVMPDTQRTQSPFPQAWEYNGHRDLEATHGLDSALGVGFAGALLIAVLQRTDWFYHFYPAEGAAILLVIALAFAAPIAHQRDDLDSQDIVPDPEIERLNLCSSDVQSGEVVDLHGEPLQTRSKATCVRRLPPAGGISVDVDEASNKSAHPPIHSSTHSHFPHPSSLIHWTVLALLCGLLSLTAHWTDLTELPAFVRLDTIPMASCLVVWAVFAPDWRAGGFMARIRPEALRCVPVVLLATAMAVLGMATHDGESAEVRTVLFYSAAAATLFGRLPSKGLLSHAAALRWISACLAALLWLAGQNAAITVRWAPRFPETDMGQLIDLVEKQAPRKQIFVFSSCPTPAFPLVNYTGATLPSGFGDLWPLPGLYKNAPLRKGQRFHKPAEMSPIERFVFNKVVDDLCANPPDLFIAGGIDSALGFRGKEFDFVAYFSQDPRFRKLWSQYWLIAQVGNQPATYLVYRLRAAQE